jgi:hypothetical protein
MLLSRRPSRRRHLRPSVDSLEGRALLNAAWPHRRHEPRGPAHVVDAKPHNDAQAQAGGPNITVINTVSSHGYQFTNFDGPNSGTMIGTFVYGISNAGMVVGTAYDDMGIRTNFAANPLKTRSAQVLNLGVQGSDAFGINSAGTVVGDDGKFHAASLSRGVVKTFSVAGSEFTSASGINDRGTIVGNDVTSNANHATPGFILVNGHTFITVNAPSGPNNIDARGINNKGLVVGFYVGADTDDHSFILNAKGVKTGTLTGTAVADPTIPAVAGENGAKFVSAQLRGINDKGIAVGSYTDSTGSGHGFLYNTKTRQYTFLDDPSEAFHHFGTNPNAVESTAITGITNSGEITGIYTDANGVTHGFVATPQRG